MFVTIAWLLLMQPPASPELMDDPRVLSFCRVLARNAIAVRDREHGAFVVRSAEGILYFVAWPPSGEKDVLRWHGRFPDGTIAILHTHAAWQPDASKVDRRTALGKRIPVYVITPFQISRTDGGPSEVVRKGEWLTATATHHQQ